MRKPPKPIPPMTEKHIDRFWKKVDMQGKDDCWLWIAGKDGYGYGAQNIDGRIVKAHRISWKIHNGNIPSGLDVLHDCDTPACVNPKHLWVGTHTENMNDKNRKGRNGFPSLKGEEHGNAKLTDVLVLEIRAEAKRGRSKKWMAKKYNVDPSTISDVVRRKSWKHVK